MREALIRERTYVGLDVHAHAVVGAALDGDTGEVLRRRLGSSPAEVFAWIRSLPGPVAVAYEAGPTGFTLARALRAGGVRCEVLAPSKLQRPFGERVKTDARDALHIAKLLRLDEIVAVTIPSESQKAARDLVRAREDARRHLMSARHRLGKLLLRRGIAHSGKTTWTTRHHDRLRRLRFELPGLLAAFDAAHEAVVAVHDRRDRLDEAILAIAAGSEFTGVAQHLSCLWGISTLTAFALAVEIGDWSRPRGTTGRATRPPRRPCAPAGCWRARKRANARTRATCGSTGVGGRSRRAANAGSSRTQRSPASSPVGAGRWR
ncbi:MAG: transposase [Trueperaceae bacterium]|nr:transposase [Trueperaceae bacterium]